MINWDGALRPREIALIPEIIRIGCQEGTVGRQRQRRLAALRRGKAFRLGRGHQNVGNGLGAEIGHLGLVQNGPRCTLDR